MDGGVTVNTISAKFSLENNDEFSVTTEFSLDMVKRKHIFIELRFCLEDGTGIKALQQDGSIAYSDAVGDIVVLVPVKRDVAEGKSLKITVPYNIFPELKPNTVVICKAALINRDETETCRQTEIKLLVNLGGRFVLYSDEKYTMYLKTTGTDQESVAWCESVISRDNIHDELLSAVLELLNELARAKNASDAQFMLYKLHSNKSLTVYNPSEAIKWLESSAANGYAEACDEIGKNGVVADILKNKDCVSAELYLKAAEEGNSEAQFTLYELYQNSDEEERKSQSINWLKRSAEGGNKRAVLQLNSYYKSVFVSEYLSNEFIGILKRADEQGCGEADLLLFEIYFSGYCFGHPVKRNKKYACEYILKAGKNGCSNALYRMWKLFENGNELLMETDEALSYLKLAAESMVPEALNDLGELYIDGVYVEADSKLGIELIENAAKLNNFDAQLKLFNLYYHGRYKEVLTEIDKEKAINLLLAYEKGGNTEAGLILWNLYKEENPMLCLCSEAMKWLTSAAENKNSNALIELSQVYSLGVYEEPDLIKARKLLEQAASLSNPEAQYRLFRLYYYGEYSVLSENVNIDKAYKWLVRAAENHTEAQFQMWCLYKKSNDLFLRPSEALCYLVSAAKNKHIDAMLELAEMHIKGELFEKNLARGISFVEKAVRQKSAKAVYVLAQIKKGEYSGVIFDDADPEEAERLTMLSAEMGYPPACYEVWKKASDAGNEKQYSINIKKLLEIAAQKGYQPAVKAIGLAAKQT